MERLDEELSGKSKLAFEAFLKMQSGKKMFEEGKIELASLLGESKIKKLSAGQKSALTKKLSKKLFSEKETKFRKDNRSDDEIKEKILKLVKMNGQASSVLLEKKLKVGERRLQRLIGELSGEHKIENVGVGLEGFHHKWIIQKTKKPRKMKERKAINGHQFKKKAKPGGGKPRGTFIDVTKPEIVKRALDLMKSDDWVTKGKLIDTIDISPGVVNRLTDHMKKQKMIIEVVKKHNPAHKNSPKNYERPLRYWAAA